MSTVHLTGPRVVLRELNIDDAEWLPGLIGHPDVFRWLLDDVVPTKEQLHEILQHRAATAPDGQPRRKFELVVTVDGAPIGFCDLEVVKRQRGELGYGLHPAYWGRGLIGEAVRLVLDFGFGTLGLHRIHATTRPDNMASRRVLERAGMRLEGHHREDTLVRGEWEDSVHYALLARDHVIPASEC
ncbi:GNAT family N-acetyltransferase [Longispora albida]|uniref:GNAT family N-acetyltransferase n=1 Tax=Longispora albida TaxID=203523 RepID=UPI000368E582|nr:GNAT family protein [Longispora albida]